MKKHILLLVFAGLVVTSCSKAKTSNVSANSGQNSNISIPQNSITSTNLNSNSNSVSTTKSEANAEILKQIEAQQLETADPRKVTRQNKANSNQAPKKAVPPGMQN